MFLISRQWVQCNRDNSSLLSYTLTQVFRRMANKQRRPFALYDKNGCSLKFIFIFSFLLLTMAPAQANVFDWRLWDADGKLKAEKFTEAKEEYLKIQVSEPNNARVSYNLGIANYREGAMTQAMNSFQLASVTASSNSLKEKAFYNLGNSQFQLENYEAAVGSYEFALELDPNDEDAKHNLELAKKKLKEQQDNKSDQNKDDKKDQDKQENQDKGSNQDDQDDKNQDDQNKDKQDQNKKPQNQPQQNRGQDKTKEGGLSEKDVERMLMQVEEADPSEVNQNRSGAQGQGQKNNLKPW